MDLEVLAGVEQGPGGRGKADGAHVEVVEARSALRENVIDPGQRAFVRGGIDAGELALENVFRDAVEFDDDDAFDFGLKQRERGEAAARGRPHHCPGAAAETAVPAAEARSFDNLQSAPAGRAEIRVAGAGVDLRDQQMRLGARHGGRPTDVHRFTDRIGVPHHIGAGAGGQDLLEETHLGSGAAPDIQLRRAG